MVLIFWGILASILVAQVLNIISYIIKGEQEKSEKIYADEAVECTEIVMHAIGNQVIKKHLITNSAIKYDSKKALQKYRCFLETDLMSDIMTVNEEKYNG